MASRNGPLGQHLTGADGAAIRRVIERQLEAFRQDDGPTAFSFASPGIQAMFGTAENFLDMVIQAYPQVYRPRAVEFRELTVHEGQPAQKVLLTGPDGVTVTALYLMQQQPDGEWRINGCLLLGPE
jgi:hypothetical protein